MTGPKKVQISEENGLDSPFNTMCSFLSAELTSQACSVIGHIRKVMSIVHYY